MKGVHTNGGRVGVVVVQCTDEVWDAVCVPRPVAVVGVSLGCISLVRMGTIIGAGRHIAACLVQCTLRGVWECVWTVGVAVPLTQMPQVCRISSQCAENWLDLDW